jgi:hypothetical protein
MSHAIDRTIRKDNTLRVVNGQFPVPAGGQQKYPPLVTILLDDRRFFT